MDFPADFHGKPKENKGRYAAGNECNGADPATARVGGAAHREVEKEADRPEATSAGTGGVHPVAAAVPKLIYLLLEAPEQEARQRALSQLPTVYSVISIPK